MLMSAKNTLDISVIIPFKDKSSMTLACVHSLVKYGPKVAEIILVSNNSSKEELELVRSGISSIENVKILVYDHPFNYQKINNWAVNNSSGAFVMFLNNDTELRENSRGLIEKMHKKASLDNVGIVGCLLLFGDEKTIQHGGVYLMPEGLAEHMYVTKRYQQAIDQAGSEKFPYDITKDIPMTAVTGAVQLVERSKLDEVHGMDERFIICGGDVDLCIRMNQAGYQTWFIGGGYILHKESVSRKFTPIPYNDFYWSYLSYVKGFDPSCGDPFLPKITEKIKVYGA